MSTTRWKDNTKSNINEAIDLLVDPIPDDDSTASICRKNWKIQKCFSDNLSFPFLSSTIEFNMVNYSYDKVTTGAEDNIVPQNGFIVVYCLGNSVYYIISKKADNKTILRKMLSYNGKNELDNDNSSIKTDSDFFLWLIKRIYYGDNSIEINDEDSLVINAIKAFQGDTEDSQTKLSASGESVMNVISALSFFLESKQLKTVTIELSYRKHSKIEITIKSDALDVDTKSYIGDFDSLDPDEKKARLHLLVYLEIIPLLIQEYRTDKENDLWNTNRYFDFVVDVANTIAKKIDQKKKSIREIASTQESPL